MALPVAPALVEEVGALTPSLFNLPDQNSLDGLVRRFVERSDAWMQAHMGGAYGLSSPSWAPVLQEEGQIYLTLEKLADVLRAEKTYGTHFPYMSEETGAYERLITTDWGAEALKALDTWVTVEIIGAGAESKGFARPRFNVSINDYPVNDSGIDPVTIQYSAELDFARGISNQDIGTLRR
jgi:hypothetical protein